MSGIEYTEQVHGRQMRFDPGPAPAPVMHRLTELDMDRAERADLERAWEAGEISGQRCTTDGQRRGHDDSGRCLHTAAYRITTGCVNEHLHRTNLLCWCCDAILARAIAAGQSECGECGSLAAILERASLRPALPDREELIG